MNRAAEKKTGVTKSRRSGRINVKAVVILLVVAGFLLGGAAVAYKVRKRIIANRALKAGKEALAQEDWAEACKQLKIYLERRPDDVPMLEEYAKANMSVQPLKPINVQATIAAYRAILRHKTGDDEISEKLVKLYLQIPDFGEAAYVCRQRLESDPADRDAALSLGAALSGLGKTEEATDVLEQLASAHPDEVDAYIFLHDIAVQERSVQGTDTARAWLDRGVANNPESAKALVVRARFHRLHTHDSEAVRVDLEAAEALHSSDPEALFLAAELWMIRGDLDRADSQLRAVAQLDEATLASYDVEPENVRLRWYEVSAKLALRREAVEEGVALADLALEELADHRRARFLPAAVELYLAAGRLDQARQCLSEYEQVASVRDSSRADQIMVLNAALTIKDPAGNPFKAINDLREVVLKDSENAPARKLLADAYERGGQPLRFMATLGKYVARVPGDLDAALRVAKAHRASHPDLALRYAERAERAHPDELDAKVLRLDLQIDAAGRGPDGAARRQELGEEVAALRPAHPGSATVRLLLAKLATANGDVDGAIAELEKAVEECDDKFSAATQLAIHAHANDRMDKAREGAEKAITLEPKLASPRILLAAIHLDGGRTEEARQTIEQALPSLAESERWETQVFLAQLLLRHGNRQDGVQLLRQLAVDHPQDVRLRRLLLVLPEVHADADESQKLVDQMREVEGEKGLLWPVEQARVWLRGGTWRDHRLEIVDLLTRNTEAGPAGPDPVLLLGQMYVMQGDLHRAEETYRRSVESRPIYVAVLQQLLSLLEHQGRFSDASELLSEKTPTDLAALSGHRVTIDIALRDYDSAIRQLRQRVTSDPEDTSSRATLAKVIYAQSKDAARAFKLLDEADARAPGSVAVLSTRVSILHAEKRDDEALELLNREVARRNDFDILLLRAVFYAKTGQFDLAEKDYLNLKTFADSTARAYRLLGRFYLSIERIDQGIAAWEEGLKAVPGEVYLRRLLTEVLLNHEEAAHRERGKRMLEELREQLPEDTSLLLLYARTLVEQGGPQQIQEAQEALTSVVRMDRHNVAAYLHLVELARRAGDQAKAGELLTEALGANPDDLGLLYARAFLRADLNELDAARELAEKVIAVNPRHAPALKLLVQLTLQAGDIAAAEKYNRELIAIDPDNETARLAHAEVLQAKDQIDEAVEYLDAYYQTPEGRQNLVCAVKLAELYRLRGDFDKAWQLIEEAERLEPGKPVVFASRLACLSAQQRFGDVAELASGLRAEGPEDVVFLEAAAVTLAKSGNADYVKQAQTLCQKVVDIVPKRVGAHVILAEVAFRGGNQVMAEQAYRNALRLDPFHQDALNGLAWILGVVLDRPDEAIEPADKGVLRYPADPHLRDTRAAVLIRLDRLPEAREDLEKCLDLARNLPSTRISALRHLGQILAKQAQPDAARQRFSEALQIDREHHVLSDEDRAEIEQAIAALPQ